MLMTTFPFILRRGHFFMFFLHAGEPGDRGEHGEAWAARGGGQSWAAHGRVQACPVQPRLSRSSAVDPDP